MKGRFLVSEFHVPFQPRAADCCSSSQSERRAPGFGAGWADEKLLAAERWEPRWWYKSANTEGAQRCSRRSCSLPSPVIYPYENESVIDVQFLDDSDSSLVIFLASTIAAVRAKWIHRNGCSHKHVLTFPPKYCRESIYWSAMLFKWL